MTRAPKKATQEDLEAELGVLHVEKQRLENEAMFRETAVENLKAMVDRARRELAESFAPVVYLDGVAPSILAQSPALGLTVIASEAFLQAELERVAGPEAAPGVPWSPLTKREVGERLIDINARISAITLELSARSARDQAAALLEKAERLERGEPEVEPEPTPEPVAAAVDEPGADFGFKGPKPA